MPGIYLLIKTQIMRRNRCEKGAGITNKTTDLPNLIKYKYERVFNYPISLSKIQYVNDSPVVFDEDDVLYFTTIMFFRDYLPTGKLLSGIFPILAAPELTDISIVLPERYWTAETLSMYMKNW